MTAPSLNLLLTADFSATEEASSLPSAVLHLAKGDIITREMMKSPLGAPAPSKSLLRFLRSQSDLYFFSANSSTVVLRQHADRTNPSQKTDRRQLSTTSHTESLWHQSKGSALKALPAPRYYHEHQSYSLQSKGSRHASTESSSRKQQSLFRRLLALRGHQLKSLPATSTSPSDDDTTAQLFNLSRALSRNHSGVDLKLRCTEFDANGSVTLVSGEFKKSELIAKYGLQPRDLRKIDSSVLPHILVRPSAILINLLHLRVLIQSDRVLVFDAYGSTDSYTQSLFMYDLEGKLRQKPDPHASTTSPNSSTHLPYEFRALEAVLISVTSGLESEFELVRDPVVRVLRDLEEDIDREKLRHLLIHSKKLGTFEQKARLVRDAINDLLEADDDLAAMYLSEKRSKGTCREEDDHQEIEMLLESYHKICDEIVEISGNLISNIRNTEEVVKAILDANRNQLMLLELKFSIGTLGLAGGTLVAGLYGMNLENFIEESDVAFGGVTAVCFGLSALIALYGMRKLRKVQKVRMWGEGLGDGWRRLGGGAGIKGNESGSNRGNWMTEAMEHEGRAERMKMLNATESLKGKNAGPVLWPGMEGLGMHKIGGGGSGEGGGGESGGRVVHDDIWEREWERERTKRERAREEAWRGRKRG